jgi:hypothetical protein
MKAIHANVHNLKLGPLLKHITLACNAIKQNSATRTDNKHDSTTHRSNQQRLKRWFNDILLFEKGKNIKKNI